jgi:hypothetical protein
MRLFHFSEDPTIALFVPRSVHVPVERPHEMAWLNGPLVWAIDDEHQAMYLFPRECPRILLWTTPTTKAEDYDHWWQGSRCRVLAYIEEAWFERVRNATIYRYEMPVPPFKDINDAGMWVSKTAVKPLRLDALSDLLEEHRARDVELRVVETLLPLKGVWRTSLHASGIRLRNAKGWGEPGWTHSNKGRVVAITEPS